MPKETDLLKTDWFTVNLQCKHMQWFLPSTNLFVCLLTLSLPVCGSQLTAHWFPLERPHKYTVSWLRSFLKQLLAAVFIYKQHETVRLLGLFSAADLILLVWHCNWNCYSLGWKSDYPMSARGGKPQEGLSCLSRNIRHFNRQSYVTGPVSFIWFF